MEPLDIHIPAVAAYVRRQLAPFTDATNDIVQEVFLAAWQNRSYYREESPLRSWLLGIAKHKVQDHFRRTRRSPQSIDELGPHQEPSAPLRVDEDAEKAQTFGRVRIAISQLPATYRAVVRDRYWAGNSAFETGAKLGKTSKSVERMLARSREQLRAGLMQDRLGLLSTQTCAVRSGSSR
jgi:RNA polymerase sigma-70 factor, ECF subfamily